MMDRRHFTLVAALLLGAAAPAPLDVDSAQRAIWASADAADPMAARAPALAALRRLAQPPGPTALKADALLLKWGTAGDATGAWARLLARHRDDDALAAILEGYLEGGRLPRANQQLAELARTTRNRSVAGSARLLLARSALTTPRRSQALAELAAVAKAYPEVPTTLLGGGDPPRLATVARGIIFRETGLVAGAPLPALAARTLAGQPVTQAALAGKPVLIDFWATWCPPCVAALPRVQALQAKHAAAGLTIVSISADDAPATVERWLARRPEQKWAHWWVGPSGRLSADWLNSDYPFYLVAGRDGRIIGTTNKIAEAETMVARAIR